MCVVLIVCHTICRWLDYLHLSKHSDLMVENEIDGKTLLSLNDEDLANLGMDDVSTPLAHVNSEDSRSALVPFVLCAVRRRETGRFCLITWPSCTSRPSQRISSWKRPTSGTSIRDLGYKCAHESCTEG
jgi:hypothetical protein